MSGKNPPGWICLAGTEIASSLRTLTYVRRGLLGNGSFEVALSDEFVPETNTAIGPQEYTNVYYNTYGVSDTYSDAYQDAYSSSTIEFDPRNLSCYCSVVDEGPYISPSEDPAPWYNGSRASYDFLGVLITDTEVGTVLSRSISPIDRGGAVLTAVRHKHRILAVSGYILAATTQGMAYGERWLTEALAGGFCDPSRDELIFLPACPSSVATTVCGYLDQYDDVYNCEQADEGYEDLYESLYQGVGPSMDDPLQAFRFMKRVGVVDGPLFTNIQDVPSCNIQKVDFQIASGVPYLFTPATVAYENDVTNDVINVLVENGDWIGDAVAKITLTQESGNAASCMITATPSDGTCPMGQGIPPCASFNISTLNSDDSFLVDGSLERVLYYNSTRKLWANGVSKLTGLNGPLRWIEIPPCSSVCIQVRVYGTTHLKIETLKREV